MTRTSSVTVNAVLTGKSLTSNPWGERMVKLEIVENRTMPGPLIIQRGGQNELSKEIFPIVNEVIRSMPGLAKGNMPIPRATLFLTEDEWNRIVQKPDIGELMKIEIRGATITIEPA